MQRWPDTFILTRAPGRAEVTAVTPPLHWPVRQKDSAACATPTAVPLNEIRRMLNKAFFSHIARPEFIIRQLAKTLKSSYRMNVMLSNLSRLGEINEDLHSVA